MGKLKKKTDSPSLADLGETALIARIRKGLPVSRKVKVAIGDDTTVIQQDKQHDLLLTVDTSIDGIDFLLKEQPADKIAKKVLAQNLSDIAAMGGVPEYALISLGMPSDLPVKTVDLFYRGLCQMARRYQVSIVGGDMSRSRQFFASVTLSGRVARDKAVLRSGAKSGDWILVTGQLGGSILGSHLNFVPRVKESLALTRRYKLNAMIDVSDGLVTDLGHLLKASGKGAVLRLDHIPIAPAARRLAQKSGETALKHALSDGEDFELLFTCAPSVARKLLKAKGGIQTRITHIGEIMAGGGLFYQSSSTAKKVKASKWQGYQHF